MYTIDNIMTIVELLADEGIPLKDVFLDKQYLQQELDLLVRIGKERYLKNNGILEYDTEEDNEEPNNYNDYLIQERK